MGHFLLPSEFIKNITVIQNLFPFLPDICFKVTPQSGGMLSTSFRSSLYKILSEQLTKRTGHFHWHLDSLADTWQESLKFPASESTPLASTDPASPCCLYSLRPFLSIKLIRSNPKFGKQWVCTLCRTLKSIHHFSFTCSMPLSNHSQISHV